ncbi:MAG: hypothetical protein WBW32_10795 [Luteibacter sp.]
MTIGALLFLVLNIAGSTWLLATSWTLEILGRRQVIEAVPHLRARALCGGAGIVLGTAFAIYQVYA